MQMIACGAFSPDFLIRMKTMIASSTTAEIESATAAHLQISLGPGERTVVRMMTAKPSSTDDVGDAVVNPYSGQQVHTHPAVVIITIHTRASIGAQPHKGAHGQYGRTMTTQPESFPRRHARTQRFTL